VRILFYAIIRPFIRQFDSWVHAVRTRFGDNHEAQFRFLAGSGAAEMKICQRDVPPPKRAEELTYTRPPRRKRLLTMGLAFG
jgi:hypothetical protein